MSSFQCLVPKKYFRLPLYDRALLTFADYQQTPLTHPEAELQPCNIRELVGRGWIKQVSCVENIARYSITDAGLALANDLRSTIDFSVL